MTLARNFVWIPLCLLLSACVNQSIKSTSVPPIQTPASNVSEAQLLDVAVVVFDPGLEDYDEDEQVLALAERSHCDWQRWLLRH